MTGGIQSNGDTVKSFYDKFGWQTVDGQNGEDKLFRTFPAGYQGYHPLADQRVMSLIQGLSGSVLFVGGGDMPQNHVRIAKQFAEVSCMDISTVALDIAREKLGEDGTYLLESIVDTELPGDQFDLVYCAHVVYHINRADQETAVRQMMRLTKPGGRVVILYANPRSPFTLPGELARYLKRGRVSSAPELYYSAQPLSWWNRFPGKILPWRIIGSRPARMLIRGDGAWFFKTAAWVENRLPNLAVRLWQFPIIIIDRPK